jgi:pimeloyl-ACP methyl ester carboxylesterase
MVGDPAHAPRFEYKSMCALENEWPVNFNRGIASLWPSVQAAVMPEADLKKITMPVLTIHGTRDRNAPYEGGRAWAASLPDARLVTIEGAAHSAWLDDPVAVFGAIRHFLRGEWPLNSQ